LDQHEGKVASALSAPRETPHLAWDELTAVEAGEIVDVNGRELAALKSGQDLQRRDFSQAVAATGEAQWLNVAVP
jgi:hypothetical protein